MAEAAYRSTGHLPDIRLRKNLASGVSELGAGIDDCEDGLRKTSHKFKQ